MVLHRSGTDGTNTHPHSFMTHLYKWPNQFSDVFIISITPDAIIYEVRDKLTGKLMEGQRTVKYVIDEIKKDVYFDERTMPLEEFLRAYQILN